MFEAFILAAATVTAFLIWVPWAWMRRLMGFGVLADFIGSTYFMWAFGSTGTMGGLTIAVLAALGLTLAIRAIKWAIGYESLTINGHDGSDAVAELLTASTHWVRTTTVSLFTGKPVSAPDVSFNWAPVKGAIA